MEDKTPIHLLSIVGIVAVVAVVYMLTNVGGSTSGNTATTASSGSGGITANVVADSSIAPVSIDMGAVGRVFIGIALIGMCVYLYYKV